MNDTEWCSKHTIKKSVENIDTGEKVCIICLFNETVGDYLRREHGYYKDGKEADKTDRRFVK